MINPDNIPIEAVEAAKSAYTAEIYKGHGTAREFHRAMAAAVAAALNGWPGLVLVPGIEQWGKIHGRHLHIPIENAEGK